MAKAPFKPRAAGSLWKATEELITGAGGFDRARDVSGMGRGTLSRYADPDEPQRSMPTHIVIRLEREAALNGHGPIVTRYLAAEAGALLLELGPERGSILAQDMAALGTEIAEVFAASAAALAGDGRVDAKEAGVLVQQLDDALRAAMRYRNHVVALRDGEED